MNIIKKEKNKEKNMKTENRWESNTHTSKV